MMFSTEDLITLIRYAKCSLVVSEMLKSFNSSEEQVVVEMLKGTGLVDESFSVNQLRNDRCKNRGLRKMLDYKEVELVSTRGLTEYRHARKAGNSTRQIDAAIQVLFEGKAVLCVDDYHAGNDLKSNQALLLRIIKRLRIEHPNTLFDVDKNKNIIKLVTIDDIIRDAGTLRREL